MDEFENGALCFSMDGNILKMELFENDDVTISRCFVCPSLPQTQVQNGGQNGDCHLDFVTCYAHAHGCTQAFLSPVIVAFSNSSSVSVDVKHLIRFSSVDEKHLMRF